MKKYLKYRRRKVKWIRKWSFIRFIQRNVRNGGYWDDEKKTLYCAPGKYTEDIQLIYGSSLVGR